jgi:hypothetical protein
MKTLYQSLLEDGLIEPDAPQTAPASEPTSELTALTGKAFAEAVLSSQEFRMYIIEGLMERDLPPAVLCRLMDHGWGKPVERVEVKDTTHQDDITPEQLEARALRLAEIARSIRLAPLSQETKTVH